MGSKRGTLIGDRHKNPEKALSDIGSRLVTVLANQAESRRATGSLWKMYVADCRKYGVKPLERP